MRQINSHPLYSARHPGPQSFPLLSDFRGVRQTKVLLLEYRANLHFGTAVEWGAFEPLHSLIERLDLPQPIARNELLRLGKWSIDDRSRFSRESHPFALRTGMQPGGREHHPGLYQFLVELPHLRHQVRAGKNARLRVFTSFHDHHAPHRLLSFVPLFVYRTVELQIDTPAKKILQSIMSADAAAAVEAVYRSDWGRIIAALITLVGDFDLAEESAHEAFI